MTVTRERLPTAAPESPTAPREPALPPGPQWPRFVQTLGWRARPIPMLERCHARYGDVFTLRIAQEDDWVMLADPEHVKQVFTGDPRLLHAGEGNQVLRPILGANSLLLLDEEPHMAQRKLLLPPFHGERMQRYRDLIAAIADEEIERWPLAEPFALWPRMQEIALEVIMRAVFGVQEAERLDRLRAALRTMLEETTSRTAMLFVVMLGPERTANLPMLKRVLEPVDELILDETRRRRQNPAVAERGDILSLLVQARHEDGRPMSDAELRDELVTLLVAGHETTATALSWALERLVRHPEMLDRLAAEAGEGEDEYADAVAKEALRLRPVLPIVARRLVEPMEIGGHLLPTGVSVTPCIVLVHRRPDVYPEPLRFRPERFLEQPAGTYTWIPFGGGVRRCIGGSFAMFEMKTVLGRVAARTRLRPARPEPERVSRRAITLTPDKGTEVVAERVAA